MLAEQLRRAEERGRKKDVGKFPIPSIFAGC
jgi:hypothetical protein